MRAYFLRAFPHIPDLIGNLNFGRPLILTRLNAFSLTLSPLKTQNRRGKCPVSTGTPSRTSTQIPGGGFGNTRRPERRLGTKFIFFLSCVFVLLKFSRFALDVMCRSVFGLSLSLSLSLSFLADTTTQHSCLTFFFNQAITGRLGRNIRRGDPGDSVLRSS